MQRETNILKNIDWWTVGIFLIIVLLGWFNIFAAVYNEEHNSILDFSQQYGKQLIWILSSLFIALIILLTDSSIYSIFSTPLYIFLLLITFSVTFFGKEINGQKAWFEIGWIRIQPSEFLKFALNLALAKFLSSYNFKIHNLKNLTVILTMILFPMVIVLMQHDTGTALVFTSFIFVLYREGLTPYVLFLGVVSIILFIMSLLIDQVTIIYTLLVTTLIIFTFLNGQLRYIISGIGIFIGVFIILWGINYLFKLNIEYKLLLISIVVITTIIFMVIGKLKKIKYAFIIGIFLIGSIAFTFTVEYIFNKVLEPHQQARINELLGKSNDLKGVGYNVNQSKIAIGSGGLWGKGFLQGTQTKYNFVPEQSTDFIFCTVGEEHGFIGSFLLLLLYTTFLLRLIQLAERQRLAFSRIYGYGVISILFFHLAINIGMTIGLVPVIGIPLPFFSYGGSSLWSFTILLFIFIKLDADRFKYLA
ncbi:MAG: rod shape-determining protein RodA [Bacteroidales bacterium]|nr:rod shape-determining protein RodA [Bacteroidales bacterium]